jgi:uncharacterized membrane protein
MSQSQDSNKRKAVQRREVLTAWILLSAPLIGFVAYLIAYLGTTFGQGNAPMLGAMLFAVTCLLLVCWLFIANTDADWRKTTRFIAIGLVFEGIVLFAARSTGREASVYFGLGSITIGLILIFAAKRH